MKYDPKRQRDYIRGPNDTWWDFNGFKAGDGWHLQVTQVPRSAVFMTASMVMAAFCKINGRASVRAAGS